MKTRPERIKDLQSRINKLDEWLLLESYNERPRTLQELQKASKREASRWDLAEQIKMIYEAEQKQAILDAVSDMGEAFMQYCIQKTNERFLIHTKHE